MRRSFERPLASSRRQPCASLGGVRSEPPWNASRPPWRSEEHTSELQSQSNLVCRLLLAKKKIPAPKLFHVLAPRSPPASRQGFGTARINSSVLRRGTRVIIMPSATPPTSVADCSEGWLT